MRGISRHLLLPGAAGVTVALLCALLLVLQPATPAEAAPAPPTASVTIHETRSAKLGTAHPATWKPSGGTASVIAGDVVTAGLPAPLGIALEQTVGLDPLICGPDSELLAPAGTVAYFCYTATNPSTTTLRFHTLVDDDAGAVLTGWAAELLPGAGYSNVNAGAIISTVVTADATRSGIWTAFDDLEGSTSAVATATVRVGAPSIVISKVVSTSDTCSGNSTLEAPEGSPLFFCVTLTNTGAFTFTHHRVEDPLLGVSGIVPLVLAPGATATISNDDLLGLGPLELTASLTNSVTVVSTNVQPVTRQTISPASEAPVQATAIATATVTVSAPTSDAPGAEPKQVTLFLPLLAR